MNIIITEIAITDINPSLKPNGIVGVGVTWAGVCITEACLGLGVGVIFLGGDSIAHDCDSAGFPFSSIQVPRLVHVLVCISLTHSDQSVQVQLWVQPAPTNVPGPPITSEQESQSSGQDEQLSPGSQVPSPQ